MEYKIIKQTKNPFLNREEIMIEIKSDSNPSYDEIKKELKKDNELTIVKRIQSNFGRKTFEAEIFVYGSKESKDNVEKIARKQKKKLEEEAKANEGAK
ncbi:MAG: hypothetical protein Q7S33_04615 [Nanoarchaeota archaeon]|nr:hypothetical protein [Nanoarchaeota archaeon]